MVGNRYLNALWALTLSTLLPAEDLGEMWGSAKEEAKYYPIVNIPIPPEVPMRTGSFEILPDGRLAVGTRRGDIYFVKGAFDSPPTPDLRPSTFPRRAGSLSHPSPAPSSAGGSAAPSSAPPLRPSSPQ